MKVVLADDHRMMRDGLRAILEPAGIEVVGEASSGYEVLGVAERSAPDVVIMDVGMPGLNGVQATRRLLDDAPRMKVVALSMHADRQYVLAMLDAGATGYVLKNAAAQELLAALMAVTRGETYLCPGVAESAGEAARRAPSSKQLSPLSSREREVLQLLAEGRSSKEIAVALGIGVPTVDTYRRQIMRKLDLRTIAALTKYAIREGLTSADG